VQRKKWRRRVQRKQYILTQTQMFVKNEFSTVFSNSKIKVLMIVDSTPLPINHCRNETKDGPNGVWDGAHRMWAYKVTAAMDLSKIFHILSPAVPATKHDIERMCEVKRDFEAGIDERDVVVADRGYQGFQHEVLKGKWIIKKKSKQISKEDQDLNSKIEDIRSYIAWLLEESN